MAAKLGSDVSMITKINPEDQFGQHMTSHFEGIGLNTEHVLACTDAPTGAATITVDLDGKNCISVCMGANSLITEQDIEDARQTIEHGEVQTYRSLVLVLRSRHVYFRFLILSVSARDVDFKIHLLAAKILICQLETPHAASLHAMKVKLN